MYENLLSKEQNRKITGPLSESQIESEKVLYFKYLRDKYHMNINDIVLINSQSKSDIHAKTKRFTFKSKIVGMDKVEINMYIGENHNYVEFELKAFKASSQHLN